MRLLELAIPTSQDVKLAFNRDLICNPFLSWTLLFKPIKSREKDLTGDLTSPLGITRILGTSTVCWMTKLVVLATISAISGGVVTPAIFNCPG